MNQRTNVLTNRAGRLAENSLVFERIASTKSEAAAPSRRLVNVRAAPGVRARARTRAVLSKSMRMREHLRACASDTSFHFHTLHGIITAEYYTHLLPYVNVLPEGGVVVLHVKQCLLCNFISTHYTASLQPSIIHTSFPMSMYGLRMVLLFYM